MKTSVLLGTLALVTSSILAADSGPKSDVLAAAKKLGEKENYSWRTTVVVPEGSRFRPGPTEGKAEKGGFAHIKMSFGDNSTEAVIKNGHGAVLGPEGGWMSLSELDNSEGPGRFLGGMVRNFKAPVEQAAELASSTKELKKEGDTYSGELTEDGAKALLTFGRRAGGDGPAVSNAQGSVKFWLQQGVLSKYEYQAKGTVSFNGNDREVDRKTTVEIKEVGTTKVAVPDEAKKKVS